MALSILLRIHSSKVSIGNRYERVSTIFTWFLIKSFEISAQLFLSRGQKFFCIRFFLLCPNETGFKTASNGIHFHSENCWAQGCLMLI